MSTCEGIGQVNDNKMVVDLQDRNKGQFGKADRESESLNEEADMGPFWRKYG